MLRVFSFFVTACSSLPVVNLIQSLHMDLLEQLQPNDNNDNNNIKDDNDDDDDDDAEDDDDDDDDDAEDDDVTIQAPYSGCHVQPLPRSS